MPRIAPAGLPGFPPAHLLATGTGEVTTTLPFQGSLSRQPERQGLLITSREDHNDRRHNRGKGRIAMMNELIDKICAQTGQPATVVTPVVGALLAHLGEVLPAPLAHQLAVILGIHQEDGSTPDATPTGTQPGVGGLLGGLAESLASGGGGTDARVAGASALINVAQSLLSGFLAQKR